MRRKIVTGLVVMSLLVALDVRRAPADQISARSAIGVIHLYQETLSKWYGRIGVQCRFSLTCSHYGEAVIGRFGVVRGGWLAMTRVVRCGPWTAMGTVDPPPTR